METVEPERVSKFFVHPTPPFDFQRSAAIHGRFRKSLPEVFEDRRYKRVLHMDIRPVLVSISSEGTVDNPKLRVGISPKLKRSEWAALKRQLQSMFASSMDFNKFSSVVKKDRLMRKVAATLRGFRPIAPPTVFEATIVAITEQQISLDAAVAIRSRMVEKFGDKVVCGTRTFYSFPTPKSLGKAGLDALRGVGLSVGKAQYIRDLSKRVSAGHLDLERLREMDDDAAIAELTEINGIGRWSAEYVLVRGMGRMNSLPADDVGIQRAVSRAYFRDRKVSAGDVRRVLKKFAPYSGVAAFYLMYYLFWEPQEISHAPAVPFIS